MTKLTEMIEGASESIGAGRIFGAPYEKNEVTIIPAARVMGGMGAGQGEAPEGGKEGAPIGSGSGGGFGMRGRPAGAYVIRGDDVTWLPAIDVNRLMLGFQLVMIVFFLMIRSIVKARAAAEQARLSKAR